MQCDQRDNREIPSDDCDLYSKNSRLLAGKLTVKGHQAVKSTLSFDRRVANAGIATHGTVRNALSDPPVQLTPCLL